MKYIPGNTKDYVKDIKQTFGKEYMYLSGEEYIGYYHTFGGSKYSGASHDEYSIKLYEYNPDPNYVKYLSLHSFYLKEGYTNVKGYYPIIEEKDYERGNFTRYFVRKRSDVAAPIIEVSKKQFETLNKRKSGINESYYMGVKVIWKISGPKNDVYKNGKIVIYGIEDTNKRTLMIKEKEMKNIVTALRNLTQFGRIKK